MKKTTKFSLFSLFSISLITPVVIATQFNSSSKQEHQNNFKNLLDVNNSVEQIKLPKNQSSLINEGLSAWDDTNYSSVLKSYDGESAELSLNHQKDKDVKKEFTSTFLNEFFDAGIVWDWGLHYGTDMIGAVSTSKYAPLDGKKNEDYYDLIVDQFNDNSMKVKLDYNPLSQSFEFNLLESKNIKFEFLRGRGFTLFYIPGILMFDKYKENVNVWSKSFEPTLNKTDFNWFKSTSLSNIKSVLGMSLIKGVWNQKKEEYVDQLPSYGNFIANAKADNMMFISFAEKEFPFEKFLTLDLSEIDNNGSSFIGSNRPKLNLSLNLPLINAINWFSQIPQNFKKLLTTSVNIEKNWVDNNLSHLFNEIFGSKAKFYEFINTYLINFANNSYDFYEMEAIQTLLNDLNQKEPSQEVHEVISKLLKGDNQIIYKGKKIPRLTKNTDKNFGSGNQYNAQILKNELKINSFKFNESTISNSDFWNPKEFQTQDSLFTHWNIFTNAMLPIFLKQNIYVTIEKTFGNQKVEEKDVLAYDANSKEFKDILAGAVGSDFDSPYSTIKIKNIKFGSVENRPFLGTKTEINTEAQFKAFVDQTKKYSTKTIQKSNELVVDNSDFSTNKKYLQATKDGIEVKFNYLEKQKPIEEGAWFKFKDNDKVEPFILIPDEAWGKDEPFETTPDSTLSELLQDGMKSTILYERAMARPFINKKQITTQDLKEGRAKYVNYDKATLVFNQQNIGDVFITKEFKDKYNSQSNKPWWTWTFAQLIEQEKKHVQNKSELEVVMKNYYQEEWFKNFIANPKLKNSKLEDFFPKVDEGRLFVVGSYKPSITSADVTLQEKSGFWYAGQQRDDYNMIQNYNYVVELEVKNKIYNSKLDQFNLAKDNYQNQNISYTQYLQLVNHLVNDLPKYFMIDSSRFVQGQIQQPKIQFLPNEGDDFLASGYGSIKIDYQKSLPIINQVGNDTFTQQLPFDLNNIIGIKEFKNTYKSYLIEDLDAYNKLSATDKESKILLDNKNNQIILGGKAITLIQNINVSGIGNGNQKDIVVIPTEYLDPKAAIYGFDQKTKKYTSLEEYQKEWSEYTQEQLFDKLFGNYNHNNKAEKLKKIVKDFKVIFSVEISQTHFKVNYQFTDPKTNQTILDTYTLEPLALTNIRPVKLDTVNKSSFKFGYDQINDADVPFQLLENELKDINKLASHFNFNSDFEKENFIRGIKSIDVKLNPESKKISISLTLNDNFVLYDDQSKLNFDILAIEVHKVELGNLDLKNMDRLVKDEVAKLNKDEDVLNYLNTLSLDTKKSFFISTNLQPNRELNLLAQENYLDQIQDIIFSFDQKDLVAKVEFKNDDNYALAKNDNLRINNFIYDLKVDLGIINPFKEKLIPWVAGISTVLLLLLSGGIGWLWLRKRKQSHNYLADAKTHKYEINEANVDFDLKEQEAEKEDGK